MNMLVVSVVIICDFWCLFLFPNVNCVQEELGTANEYYIHEGFCRNGLEPQDVIQYQHFYIISPHVVLHYRGRTHRIFCL